MAQTQNQVSAVGAGGAVGAGPANQQAPAITLTLENIGPLKEVQVELIRGLTVLYGLHSTGKTTVARALRLLALMNVGVVTAEDVVRLVKRHLRHMAEKEGKAGRIVYGTADAELEILCIPNVRGTWLRIGNKWERHVVDVNERLPTVERPRVVLFWVTHDLIKLYGVGTQEWHLSLESLLNPSVFRNVVAHIYDDVMDLYEETLNKVNEVLEVIDYAVIYRDGVYFKEGIHVYEPNEVASGVKRFTLVYLAAVMAETFDEYAKVTPVVFVENIEDSLDIPLMSTIIDILRTKGIISIAETHSGFPLRTATIRRNMSYYVFADGRATRELSLELFRREIEEWSDLDAL